MCSTSQELSPRRETGRGLFESDGGRHFTAPLIGARFARARYLATSTQKGHAAARAEPATAAKTNWRYANADRARPAGARRRHHGSRTASHAFAPTGARGLGELESLAFARCCNRLYPREQRQNTELKYPDGIGGLTWFLFCSSVRDDFSRQSQTRCWRSDEKLHEGDAADIGERRDANRICDTACRDTS
jgi:hypothetical protein